MSEDTTENNSGNSGTGDMVEMDRTRPEVVAPVMEMACRSCLTAERLR